MELKDKTFLLPNAGTAQEFIHEFLSVLRKEYDNFNDIAFNEYIFYLQGQRNMLKQIIVLLEKEIWT